MQKQEFCSHMVMVLQLCWHAWHFRNQMHRPSVYFQETFLCLDNSYAVLGKDVEILQREEV